MSWIDKNIPEDVTQYLFNIKITSLPSRIGVYQRFVKDDVMVHFEDLEKQLEETPEIMAFYNQLLAEQSTKRMILLRKKDIMRGKITKRMLEEADTDVRKRIRREDLKDIINADPGLIDIERDIIMETRAEEKLKSVIKALQMKSEHLRSLAGFKKEELKSSR